MKHRLNIFTAIIYLLTTIMLCTGATYRFEGVAENDYCSAASYEERYGAQFNYSGMNPSKFQTGQILYGFNGITDSGIVDLRGQINGFVKTLEVAEKPSFTSNGVQDSLILPNSTPEIRTDFISGLTDLILPETRFTSVTGMELADGSIGSLSIPSLRITRKVWEGETSESLAKGMGHYSTTSAWDGNVGLCVHNRGSANAAGQIKNLNPGDEITYSTALGSRMYRVQSVYIIANDDWTSLQPTADNRLTITTCLADHPESRVCIQAVEK